MRKRFAVGRPVDRVLWRCSDAVGNQTQDEAGRQSGLSSHGPMTLALCPTHLSIGR